MYKIYCDGACSGNGDTNAYGGWAFAVYMDDNMEPEYYENGHLENTTNNIAELTAAINGAKYIKSKLKDIDNVEMYIDSAYIVNCENQGWYIKWKQNGWYNSKKEKVANKELWQELIPYFEDIRYRFIKVKGHSIDARNNFVDKLAVSAKIGE